MYYDSYFLCARALSLPQSYAMFLLHHIIYFYKIMKSILSIILEFNSFSFYEHENQIHSDCDSDVGHP